MAKLIMALLLTTLLAGCESMKLRNLGKTGVTTGISYLVAGTVPALATGLTAIAYDEIVPEDEKVADIKTKEQAVAYVLEKGIVWSVVGFIAFLLISLIIAPWVASKRAYGKAKDKYKNE
jgi:Na+/H+-dicarboxylate symporter